MASYDEEVKAKFLVPAPKLGGKAVVAHISALLDHPKVLVFGEFLAMSNFQVPSSSQPSVCLFKS